MKKNIKAITFCCLTILLIGISGFSEIDTRQPTLNLGPDAISAEMVNKSFDLAGQKNKHSRLFFNTEDIKRINDLYRQHDRLITIGYDNLKKNADNILKQPLMSYKLDDAHLRIGPIHSFSSQVPALVMMYKLTGNKTYADRCYAQLEVMASYPDWGADRHFLDTGISGFDIALAYDGLYDYLSEQQKTILRNAALKNLFLPAQKQMAENKFWHRSTNNWNGICNGGVIMAALAMYESDEALMSSLVATAANSLPLYIHEFEPDGQSVEGLSYWGYGLMYTTIAMESMQRVLGTTFNLDNTNGFRKTGWFPKYASGPVSSLNLGDDNIKNTKSGSFFWFAKRFNDAALAQFQYDLCLQHKGVSWMDMLYYNPGQIDHSAKPKDFPTEIYIHGIELMSLRDSWNDDALFISFHGGKNNRSHGHLDAGSFDIQAEGEVWANGDLGSDNYTFPGYFSNTTVPAYFDNPGPQTEPGRFHFYRLRAEGTNSLVFNPSTCPDQYEKGEAKPINQVTGANESSYTIDLSDCYQRDVKSYSREILLNKTSKVMSVIDNFKTKRASVVWWGMHTKAVIKVFPGGKSAELGIGGKKFYASIVSPADAKFQVLDATYLPGESFPLTKNSENSGINKLAIKLDHQTENTIQVDFSSSEKMK